MYYLNIFFVYSILGHLLETFIYLIHHGESGILYGFWTPVYGIGCIIIIASYNALFHKHHLTKSLEMLTVFLIGAFLLTSIEWIGGVLIETLFGYVFWDYSKLPFHIGHYIAWEMALVWGVCAMILIFIIQPFMNHFIQKIPKWITYILLILFIIDVGCTICFKL